MKVSPAGVALIKRFEGFVGHQYRDSVGVPTIGYGTTEADVSPLPTHVTEAGATKLLEDHLDRKYIPAIALASDRLNQNQIDALASFIYNVGTGGIASSTHVGQALRAGQLTIAAQHLLDWDKAGGQVLMGLRTRREAEKALFLKPVAKPDPLASLLPFEKTLVHKYDALLKDGSKKHHDALATLRAQMTVQRKRIWSAAQLSGWSHASRRARYQILLSRTHP